MTLQRFTNQLNKVGKLGLVIQFRRPHIKNVFIEKYVFKKVENNIESYENGKKVFETNSIPHMYFIYRKALTFEKYQINKTRAKARVKYAGIIANNKRYCEAHE